MESKIGKIYIGDPCYVLDKPIYNDIWGNKDFFKDGEIKIPKGTTISEETKEVIKYDCVMTVASTGGDFTFELFSGDSKICDIDVESGSIGIIPVEICNPKKLQKYSSNIINASNAILDKYYTKDSLIEFKIKADKEYNIRMEMEDEDE